MVAVPIFSQEVVLPAASVAKPTMSFVMTSEGPPSQAGICVQAGEHEAEIVLTLTQPGDVRDWAPDTGQLAELASILGGTAHTERGPARWQVRITLPRQCAVDDRRH